VPFALFYRNITRIFSVNYQQHHTPTGGIASEEVGFEKRSLGGRNGSGHNGGGLDIGLDSRLKRFSCSLRNGDASERRSRRRGGEG